MCMNVSKNILFYENYNYLCDCAFCCFYIENIENQYHDLSHILNKWGIDIKKPFETPIPYLEKDNIIFPYVQYIVMGKYNKEMKEKITNEKITMAKHYPDPKIDEDYFVIEIGPILFNKSLAKKDFLLELGE